MRSSSAEALFGIKVLDLFLGQPHDQTATGGMRARSPGRVLVNRPADAGQGDVRFAYEIGHWRRTKAYPPWPQADDDLRRRPRYRLFYRWPRGAFELSGAASLRRAP